MDALFARYLDGELDEDEARAFAEAVSEKPELEAELRRYEHLLAAGRSLERPAAPAGFTGRVMDAIGELAPAATRPSILETVAGWFGLMRTAPASWRISWARAAVAVATLILAFIGGLHVGQSRGPAAISGTRPVSVATGQEDPAAAPSLHVVRLVYVPHDPTIERVTVAGTFNDWQPDATALQRVDGLWSTTLVLPAGSYEYMFVENGERWKTDPLATVTRDDGFGNMNAVLDLGA